MFVNVRGSLMWYKKKKRFLPHVSGDSANMLASPEFCHLYMHYIRITDSTLCYTARNPTARYGSQKNIKKILKTLLRYRKKWLYQKDIKIYY